MWWSEVSSIGAALRRLVLLGCLGLGLSACGFRPLYQVRSSTAGAPSDLSSVEVAPAQNRLTQQVRNNLLERLTPRGSSSTRYVLSLGVSEQETGVLVTRSDTVTRYNLVVTTGYVLVDKTTNTQVLKGQVNSIAAYNVVQNDFSNLTAEQAARANAARELADQIRERLAAYLQKPQTP
jgi:LPS-assembly lipoprotein